MSAAPPLRRRLQQDSNQANYFFDPLMGTAATSPAPTPALSNPGVSTGGDALLFICMLDFFIVPCCAIGTVLRVSAAPVPGCAHTLTHTTASVYLQNSDPLLYRNADRVFQGISCTSLEHATHSKMCCYFLSCILSKVGLQLAPPSLLYLLTDAELSIGDAGGAARRPNQTPIPVRPKGSSAAASPDLDRPSIASEGPGDYRLPLG